MTLPHFCGKVIFWGGKYILKCGKVIFYPMTGFGRRYEKNVLATLPNDLATLQNDIATLFVAKSCFGVANTF
jgi:hypothetical protein